MRFLTAEHAAIAAQALGVDDELQPSKASKALSVEGDALVARLSASEARLLRAVLSSYYDMLGVVVRTLREFG